MLTLHFAPNSRASRIYWLLEELDLPFELNRMDFHPKDLKSDLQPAVDSPEFPAYLQWFHYCEGMVMPPINTIVVHTILLPPDRRDQTALDQVRRLLAKALDPVEKAFEGREYLAGEFSAADCMLGHSCIMASRLGMVTDEMPNLKAYVARLMARPACAEAFAA